MMDAHLRFSPGILTRLGEELVPHADQGLLELAKNAYDADATECSIQLTDVHKLGGTIVVSDNGAGMDASAIESGWLILGASGKRRDLTEIHKRVPVGDKGLGRLAALRLGRRAVLKTRPRDDPGTEYTALLNWDDFSSAHVVEAVPIAISAERTTLSAGTDIEIQELRKTLTKSDVQRLSRNLILMSDPFGGEGNFHTSLSAPEFADLEALVKNAYFDDATFYLRAELGKDGQATFRASDWKGKTLWEETVGDTYDTVPAVFELWVFVLNKETFSVRSSTVSEVRKWLAEAGGTHIYEEGIRVAPYGGAGADWLEMNLMRARSPEERPSTNTTIGRMKVSECDGRLIQKTDRVGYIENETFLELKRFGQGALNWLAIKRLKEAEKRRTKEKVDTSKESTRANSALDIALDKAVKDPEGKRAVERAVKSVVGAAEREKKSLQDELQLYRSLATAGMTAAVFSHEISHPIRQVDKLIGIIHRRVPEDVRAELDSTVSRLNSAKEKLLAYTRLPLKLLRSEKRRTGVQDFHQIIRDVSSAYGPVLGYEKIKLELDLAPGKPNIIGTASLIEGIFANFFANAIQAFNRVGTPAEERLIRIKTEYGDESLQVFFEDSGPGINDILIDEIWLPGKTTDTSDLGTGFGLTIVRDSIGDLGGTVAAKENGEIGGAEFILSIPLVGVGT